MTHWTDFGLRHRDHWVSGRRHPESVPAFYQPLIDRATESLTEPLQGITAAGNVVPGLFDHEASTDTAPVLEAALAFLATLDADQADRAQFPVDANERRLWLNMQPCLLRHGLLLDGLTTEQRQAAMGVVAASLSTRGYRQTRDIMAINGLLVEVTGKPDEYGEWPYFFSFFGSPTADGPWGWQLDGHHVNLNCTIAGDRLVFTPSFLGSEPCSVDDGPLAGTEVFGPEQQAGLNMIRSLDHSQFDRALVDPTMAVVADHPADGRMRFAAFRDNAVEPYTGLSGADMSDAQRRLLLELVGTYLGWAADGVASARRDLVAQHLDETWFCWRGTTNDQGPFYYRVHGPVALVEFDHQPGVVFDNDQPSRHHIHTVVRTPNGGDYGVDLLARHHEHYDHSTGEHQPHDH